MSSDYRTADRGVSLTALALAGLLIIALTGVIATVTLGATPAPAALVAPERLIGLADRLGAADPEIAQHARVERAQEPTAAGPRPPQAELR